MCERRLAAWKGDPNPYSILLFCLGLCCMRMTDSLMLFLFMYAHKRVGSLDCLWICLQLLPICLLAECSSWCKSYDELWVVQCAMCAIVFHALVSCVIGVVFNRFSDLSCEVYEGRVGGAVFWLMPFSFVSREGIRRGSRTCPVLFRLAGSRFFWVKVKRDKTCASVKVNGDGLEPPRAIARVTSN